MTTFGMPHRVQAPNSKPRTAVVFALGEGADTILATLTKTAHPHTTAIASKANNDAQFEAVAVADLVFLVATEGDNFAAAKHIGEIAHAHGLLVTGVLVTAKPTDEVALKTLRVGADMLVVASDADYLSAMLSSLGC